MGPLASWASSQRRGPTPAASSCRLPAQPGIWSGSALDQSSKRELLSRGDGAAPGAEGEDPLAVVPARVDGGVSTGLKSASLTSERPLGAPSPVGRRGLPSGIPGRRSLAAASAAGEGDCGDGVPGLRLERGMPSAAAVGRLPRRLSRPESRSRRLAPKDSVSVLGPAAPPARNRDGPRLPLKRSVSERSLVLRP